MAGGTPLVLSLSVPSIKSLESAPDKTTTVMVDSFIAPLQSATVFEVPVFGLVNVQIWMLFGAPEPPDPPACNCLVKL